MQTFACSQCVENTHTNRTDASFNEARHPNRRIATRTAFDGIKKRTNPPLKLDLVCDWVVRLSKVIGQRDDKMLFQIWSSGVDLSKSERERDFRLNGSLIFENRFQVCPQLSVRCYSLSRPLSRPTDGGKNNSGRFKKKEAHWSHTIGYVYYTQCVERKFRLNLVGILSSLMIRKSYRGRS